VKQRIEVIDGREYVVTTLPKDKRLSPSQAKKRQLFQALSTAEKQAYISGRIRAAKRRKRRRRTKKL
jgi:hypothetical protein